MVKMYTFPIQLALVQYKSKRAILYVISQLATFALLLLPLVKLCVCLLLVCAIKCQGLVGPPGSGRPEARARELLFSARKWLLLDLVPPPPTTTTSWKLRGVSVNWPLLCDFLHRALTFGCRLGNSQWVTAFPPLFGLELGFLVNGLPLISFFYKGLSKTRI